MPKAPALVCRNSSFTGHLLKSVLRITPKRLPGHKAMTDLVPEEGL